jgi:hypothetical protein
MALTLMDRKLAPIDFGATFRAHRPGPERDLIEWFIEREPIRIPRGCRATLFCEPQLDSGVPDLVLVLWNEAVTRKWSPSRLDLTNGDLRLMHYLAIMGPQDEEDLERFFPKQLPQALERLEAADMIRLVADEWVPRALSAVFAARHIIAIEAKISEWGAALDQARQNFWFASNSFVLFPRLPRDSKFQEAANASGIGVWSRDDAYLDAPSLGPARLPRSYASWLFNEWAWRAATIDAKGRA